MFDIYLYVKIRNNNTEKHIINQKFIEKLYV